MQTSNIPTIGIIGGGFVGSSVAKGFQHYTNVKLYDVNPERANSSYIDVLNQDILFVCLPTPMNADGKVNINFVKDALTSIVGNLNSTDNPKPVIIKSTIPPVELQELMSEFPELFIVFCPEFLTERTAEYDFQQTNRLIFGVYPSELTNEPVQVKLIKTLFEYRFPMVPQYWVPFEAASLVKYFSNVFFATKLSLMNEYHQICSKFGLDSNDVIGLMMLDQRIGRSHFKVPGHDGGFGWGGHCFIKDMQGYMDIAKNAGVSPILAKAAWIKNVETRTQKVLANELKNMIGRAASEEFTEDGLMKLGLED